MADSLDSFLDAKKSCEPNDALKERVRDRTTRVLRWRRRGKRGGWALIMAVCYLGGLATSHWFAPPQPTDAPQRQSAPVVAVQTAPADEQQTTKIPSNAEFAANDQPALRALLLREAGDYCLEQHSDCEAALRYYSASIEVGGVSALADSSDDSWLLMAIKDARRKESTHAD
jgi:hypothetical protein